MRAILSEAIGGPETLVLGNIADPTPTAGQVVIDVKAAGVNYPDVIIIRDMYQFKPARPFSPGGEVAGIVSAVGEGVTTLKVGDEVIASCGWGGMAEKVAVLAAQCMPKPPEMPFEEAAAFIMTYGTSHYAITGRANPKAGETLLILGAAGGVGIAAIEVGKAIGLKVIAGCSSQEKVDFCISKGADAGFVYQKGALDRDAQKALSSQIKEISGGGVDIIYDPVGGDYAEPALRAMNWEGRYLVVGFPAGIPKMPLNLTLLKSCDIRGVFWGMFVAQFPDKHAANVSELMRFYQEGKVKPHISDVLPLEHAGEAIRRLQDREAQGKIVVSMG